MSRMSCKIVPKPHSPIIEIDTGRLPVVSSLKILGPFGQGKTPMNDALSPAVGYDGYKRDFQHVPQFWTDYYYTSSNATKSVF